MRSSLVAAILALCGAVSAAPAASASPTFQFFTRLGDRAVFLGADSDLHQCVLWITDGTSAGTARLADLCAGTPSTSDVTHAKVLGVAGTTAFLADPDGRLWRTDGTVSGTRSLPATAWRNAPPVIGPGGLLYFAACGRLCQPWRSDGTAAGTFRLSTVALTDFVQFVVVNDHEVAFDGVGTALWTTNGIPQGTHELVRLPAAGELVAVDGALYASRGHSSRSDLWFVPPGGHSFRRLGRFPDDFLRSRGVVPFKVGGRLLLGAGDLDAGPQLWEIRPVRHQPKLLAVFTGGLGSFAAVPGVDGAVVFFASSASGDGSNRLSLWRLASGSDVPLELADCPGGCPEVSGLARLSALGGRLFFPSSDSADPNASGSGGLWETDGTGPGTRLVKEVCTSPGCDGLGSPAPALGRLFFVTEDHATEHLRLWVTDGTAAGTQPLALASDFDFAEIDGRIVFAGVDDAGHAGPWVSDGTPGGTQPLVLP